MGAPSTVASSPPEPQGEPPAEPTPTVPLVSQPVPAIALPSSIHLTMEEKLKNAAAVAARLSALAKSAPPEPLATATEAPPGPSESTTIEEQPTPAKGGSFAERYMAKHGHVKGQGLGASGSGIAQPLVMERVKAAKAPKGSEAEVPKGAKGMGIGGKAMGRLVNANAEEKNRAELEKYGESSRIVVLTNMVGVEDVDEDLQTEIGEECSKHGVVERVLVHVMHPPPADPGENVRIFVQFSGPAGAWKAVRELDGRFFGGRTVRARYFGEQRFARMDIDTPL